MPFRNSKSKAQRLRRKKELVAEMKLFYSQSLTDERIECYSQDATTISSESTRNGQTFHPSEKKQKCFDFLKNVTIMAVPVIKKEIIDPSEENQELIFSKYPQHTTSIDHKSAAQNKILDSSKINKKFLLPNIKVEPTDIENSVDEPLRSEGLCESGTSFTLKYKLTKCSVLLHDCLIPETLAAISSNFKSLKINKDISRAYHNDLLSVYPQHMTSTDLMSIEGTEILDSSKRNQKLLLPNIKVEPTDIDNAVDESLRSEGPSESENSLTLKYKLTKCSVLLQDCLIPEILAAISSNFKSLKINKDFSNAYPNIHLYPFCESPFFSHISDAYKNVVSSEKVQKPKPCKVDRFTQIKKKKVNITERNVNPIEKKVNTKEKKVRRKPKYICNCYNTITMGSQLNENNFELTQLCSCVTSDFMLSENRKPEEISLFDPDFGKIICGINKIY